MGSKLKIAVVIPCYKVLAHIESVVAAIPSYVEKIYVVDDQCPEGSGQWVQEHIADQRLTVLFHELNQGVGGAVMTGYRAAAADGMDIVVKIDGDGQMDPELIRQFTSPIERGEADYTKGNRFYRLESLQGMPPARLFGNAVLSFITKLSSGYWNLMDPTNGYTAIHTSIVRELPLDKISKRYFFESDMLFRLGTVRAVVRDIPMHAVYADEVSNLKIHKVIPEFLWNHGKRLFKRYTYLYWLRDFNMASLYSLLSMLLLAFGGVFGATEWVRSISSGIPATSGSIMLSALPTILGIQFLLAFVQYDLSNVPDKPLHKQLN